ncbi:hypothetical protein BCR37DRAFT_64017 [Protomyces lactucae-debilis]|uniref:JmjC domain-containing protein n=1 Tax=Protomyces lactucae-debilis TaxID=2754530 RepID=A0A1Y2FBS7_PROLT|nr:uncharacterized protein BCR37DRAFT_64017 [Protomyces lactucae-debilis]ORY80315.1 hypothetical protein BCR37DRAFT_64017 [Protomyces lactucae-debilis]
MTTAYALRRHPNGIRPAGNYAPRGQRGSRLAQLPEELLLLLYSLLETPDLLSLCHTAKLFYAYSLSEEIWKERYVEKQRDDDWRGSWRETCLKCKTDVQVSCSSDLLFTPFANAQLDIRAFLPTKQSHMIARHETMSLEQFQAHQHAPFILTKAIQEWPALSWSCESLLSTFAKTRFRAECVDWPLERYVRYMRDNQDESPLYLFDARFGEKISKDGKSLAHDYSLPTCFAEDAFNLLADDRPDHRWLILGPANSGSTFHKDPNGTCAWNAVLSGSQNAGKYWIMFPPRITPPGVYVSSDESEVTSPLSIAEWLQGFHAAARKMPDMREGVCAPGEVLYVPSGWWHLVVNLDECLALTQNFVPRGYIGAVLRFLRDKPDQVSGFGELKQQPYEVFRQRAAEAFPEEVAAFEKDEPTVWQKLTHDKKSASFSFGFACDSDGESD